MKNNLETMRHSAAHLLASAVKKLFPNTSLGIGPTIEDGFYYDFDSDHQFTPDDFKKIEKVISDLKKAKLKFERLEMPISQARGLAKKLNEPYKVELINDLEKQGEKKVSFYKTGEFIDLCSGPHVADSSQAGEIKLLSVAGAYWKGSEKNKMLQRIYGTAWHTAKDLENYLQRLEQAKERDHRKIGKELDLFVFSDLIGKGLPLFTHKGATIKRVLERFIVDEEIRRGYLHVSTPVLAKTDLYRLSGHYPYYKEEMYPPMKIDEEELILRPMTCPHHFMLYKSRPRTYRELPLRFAEISPQFRYEKSGELTGLSRVRTFTLTDAHIFVDEEKVEQVINEVLDLIADTNKILGFEKGSDFNFRLSLADRHNKEKYFNDPKAWDMAEGLLSKILKKRGEPFYEAAGEAAFYGPKIDIQMKNVLGKEETVFTVQYDFVMPKRFNLTFTDRDGKERQPFVIHRSSIGALERVIAFLLEKTGGALPSWLAPTQVLIIPIADRHIEYAEKILLQLKSLGFRAEMDDRNERMQAKIRIGQIQKIPFMVIIGDKEQAQKKLSVRSREKGEIGSLSFEEFSKLLMTEANISHG